MSLPGPLGVSVYPEQSEVLTAVAEWKERLGLGNWTIRVAFDREMAAGANTDVWWMYQEAAITFNLTIVTVEMLERVVVHELAHVLTSPMMGNAKGRAKADRNELAATWVTDAIRQVWSEKKEASS